MASIYLPLLGLAFALCSAIALILNPKRRNLLLGRLVPRRRSESGESSDFTSSKPTTAHTDTASDYKDVFPPSRREVLRDIYDRLPAKLKGRRTPEQLVYAHGAEVLHEKRPARVEAYAPIEKPAGELPGELLTPTGFSVDEIRKLGDFPDYAALSDVPPPQEYKGFDINRALARPYRPFRWAYHQTMSLTKLEPDWWLEVENSYAARISQRKAIHAKDSPNVLQYLPGSEMACKELMEMALSFLCARYPQNFTLEPPIDHTRPEAPRPRTFRNGILGTTTDIGAKHPLEVLLENVPEDFGIMLRDPRDGGYYLRAGMICSALGWNVGTKLGKRLHEVHEPVPDYKEKMKFSMDRYFAKMPTSKPIQRGSWGFEVDEPLYMPPGNPHADLRNVQLPPSELPLSRLNLRVDWQTLRRLPLTGAIVFNFKALFSPIEKFRDEPYVPALALKVLREGNEAIMEYKGTWHVKHVVESALDSWAREQVERGTMEAGWRESTLEESPWFPGWEEKWHHEQGF